GASCHSLAEAQAAERDGAHYLIFGPVFSTPSKSQFGAPQGIARLEEACRAVRIPVLAIGGITLDNAHECLRAGAAGIAAIRLFQDASDLPALVSSLRKA
ncbi:MAG: thiamine phosphate synthase, partial [Acidobacteria bacterium]|nr:thiamine phosphate synthase [Acidobacteriota bacterium]